MIEKRALELLRIAEEASAQLRGLEAMQWLERLGEHYAECALALDWFLGHGRGDEGLRLAMAFVDFCQSTDRISEGRGWLDQALVVRSAEDDVRADALFSAGLLAFWQGADSAAQSLHESCLDLSRSLPYPTGIALALTGLARLALRTDVSRGRALSREALSAVEGSIEWRGRSSALHLLGAGAQMAGDLVEARQWMTQRMSLIQSQGDLRSAAGEAGNLSTVEGELGNLTRAGELAEYALRLTLQRGDSWMLPYCLNGFASLAICSHDYVRAVTLLAAADHLVTVQGAAWPPDERPQFERSQATTRAALAPADFARAWSAGHSMSAEDAVAYVLPG